MGEVYRAEHQLAGRVVALKLLRSDFAEDEELTRRFFQEAQAVNRIRHPNIVDVLDAGFSDEGPYVAMECLEGVNLSGALARLGQFDVAQAISVVLPMLDALDAAHRHGIVHRDLKPENVYLSRAGHEIRVKLLDFGIAKVVGTQETSSPRTHTGVIFGTPDYLSPEQATGEGVVDGRSDLFSVGIVLFELLTARRPFEARSAVATAYRIVHEAAPTLTAMGASTDPLLQTVLDIALAKNPEERFATAASFADMLAPLVPDGATRRETLRAIVEAAVAMQPTEAAPPVDKSERELGLRRPLSTGAPHAPSAPPVRADGPRDVRPAEPLLDAADAGAALESAEGNALMAAGGAGASASDAPNDGGLAALAPTLASNAFAYAPAAGSFASGPAFATSPPAHGFSGPFTPAPPSPRPSPIPAQADSAPRRSDPSLRAPSDPLRSSRPVRGIALRPGWTPRPLPSHVRGRYHVRGTLVRAVDLWVERSFGQEARAEALAWIPSQHAETFRNDGYNALVWYELEIVDTYIEATTAAILRGDAGRWRELARDNFDRELAPILRPSQRIADAPQLLRRTAASWGRIFDFGAFRVGEPSGGRVALRVEAFEAASLAIRYVTVGCIEAMLRGAGVLEPQVRVVVGETSFGRDLELDVGWHTRGFGPITST